MIHRPTVFVIGAGAHCPYGFPDGRKLIDEITTMLPAPDDHKNNFRSLFCYAYTRETQGLGNAFSHFRTLLDNGSHTSIDSFLATHAKRNGFALIGKFAVAHALLPREFTYDFSRTKRYNSKETDQDWLSYLLGQMVSGCRSPSEFIENNKVSFVTFNYDRTLEHFLCMRIAHTYGISATQAWECAQNIPIVHVYGSLGEFKPELPELAKRRRDGHYPDEIKAAAESIRLMYDDRGEHSNVDAAKELLKKAKKICFLGFAFDGDNIAHLELSKLRGLTYASRYRMPDGEWEQALNKMQPASLVTSETHRDWDALAFLRESIALV